MVYPGCLARPHVRPTCCALSDLAVRLSSPKSLAKSEVRPLLGQRSSFTSDFATASTFAKATADTTAGWRRALLAEQRGSGAPLA